MTSSLRFGATLVLATTSLAVGGAAAQAQILPGRGAAGVSLGHSREAVLAKLGQPRSVTRTPGPGGFRRNSFTGLEVYTNELSRVFMIVVTGRSESLSNGLRNGSTLARLKATFPDSLRCSGESGRTSLCSLTTTWRQTGASAELSTTEFMIDRAGRVERITIYRGGGS